MPLTSFTYIGRYTMLQQQWMSAFVVQHSVTCAYLEGGRPKPGILYTIWESILAEMTQCEPYSA